MKKTMKKTIEKDNKSTNTSFTQNVAFISVGKCHPVTAMFAESINATPYVITKGTLHSLAGIIKAFVLALKIPQYNIYFLESAMSIFVPVFKRMFLREKNIIVFRGNDGLFGEKTGTYLDSKNPIKRAILKYLIKRIDAVSTESEMAKVGIKEVINVPVAVNESFVEEKEKLVKIKQNLTTKKFLFIGAYRPPGDHKGCEILLEVFRLLEKEGCTLTMIGSGTEALKEKAPENVFIKGYVQDLLKEMQEHSYYIHLARYETGPITILEGAMAGLITIASDRCGHSAVLENVDSKLVIPLSNTQEMAEHIKKIISINQKKKEQISQKLKEVNQSYGTEEMIHKFKRSFEKLVEETKKY